jgi:hypothetical protein
MFNILAVLLIPTPSLISCIIEEFMLLQHALLV